MGDLGVLEGAGGADRRTIREEDRTRALWDADYAKGNAAALSTLQAEIARQDEALARVKAEMAEELFRAGNHPALGIPAEQVERWQSALQRLSADRPEGQERT